MDGDPGVIEPSSRAAAVPVAEGKLAGTPSIVSAANTAASDDFRASDEIPA